MSGLLRWIRRPEPTARALFRKRLVLVVVPFAMVGAAMELFMIQTGFYTIATRKEAERRIEAVDLDYHAKRAAAKKKAEEQQQQQQQPGKK